MLIKVFFLNLPSFTSEQQVIARQQGIHYFLSITHIAIFKINQTLLYVPSGKNRVHELYILKNVSNTIRPKTNVYC